MTNGVLVLAYPGTGKTFIADRYDNVADLEFQHYRYDYGIYKNLPLEELKGKTDIRKPKDDWPNNFFKVIKEELQKREFVFVPFVTSLLPFVESITNKNTKVIIAIPNKNSLKNLIKVYKDRGNSEEFIERRKKDFSKAHDIIDKLPYEKIYLEKNEFLLDALINRGYILKKGKGYKNYF